MSAIPSDSEVGGAWTAYVLGELFDKWPRRLDFNALDVASVTISPRNDPEELFDDLFNWLNANGYIHIGQDAGEGHALLVSLTNQGFSILGQKPKGFEQPLGRKLKTAAAAIGSQTGGAVISELIGTMVGAASKQFFA